MTTLSTHYKLTVPGAAKPIGLTEKAYYIHPFGWTAGDLKVAGVDEVASLVYEGFTFNLNTHILKRENGLVKSVFYIEASYPYEAPKEVYFLEDENVTLPHYEMLADFILTHAQRIMLKEKSNMTHMLKFPYPPDTHVFTHTERYLYTMDASLNLFPPLLRLNNGLMPDPMLLRFVEHRNENRELKEISGLYSFDSHAETQYDVYRLWGYQIEEEADGVEAYIERQKNDFGMTPHNANRISLPYRLANHWFEHVVTLLGIRRDAMTLEDLSKVQSVVTWMHESPECVRDNVSSFVGADEIVSGKMIGKAYELLMGIFATIPTYKTGGNNNG